MDWITQHGEHGFVNTLPTPLQRQGDFSEFLTGAQALDSNKQPILTLSVGRSSRVKFLIRQQHA